MTLKLASKQVNPEKGSQFEQVWKERKSTLLGEPFMACPQQVLLRARVPRHCFLIHVCVGRADTPGFMRFALLKGDEAGRLSSSSKHPRQALRLMHGSNTGIGCRSLLR